MNFDIVITTFNRPGFVESLVKQINACNNPLPKKIIIVDASDEINVGIQQYERVIYFHSSHKNQPYQRNLGFYSTTEEIVVFFDDDVKILNKNLFLLMSEKFKDKDVVGVTLNFKDDGYNAITKSMQVNKSLKQKNKILSYLWTITGTPPIKDNRIWLAGLRGKTDFSLLYTTSMSGPGTLSFRRAIVKELFDNILFSLYEIKKGKGEDKYISMAAVKYGKIAMVEEVCLLHPSHDSSYFNDVESFTRREMFSRLWLSKRYADIKQIPVFLIYIHYYWYALWRILIAGTHTLLRPKRVNFDRFIGRIKGVYDSILIRMNPKKLCPDINWENEIINDTQTINK